MIVRRRSSRTRRTSKKKKTALRTTRALGTAIARSFGLSIKDDRLVGSEVSFVETPNKGGDLSPRYLVFHYTAGRSATSSINWLTNPESKASAHLVLARDGTITQLAPFNIKTWHAGLSHWDGLSGLNSSSIGIEMDNAGPRRKWATSIRLGSGRCMRKTELSWPSTNWTTSLAGGMPTRKSRSKRPWSSHNSLFDITTSRMWSGMKISLPTGSGTRVRHFLWRMCVP